MIRQHRWLLLYRPQLGQDGILKGCFDRFLSFMTTIWQTKNLSILMNSSIGNMTMPLKLVRLILL